MQVRDDVVEVPGWAEDPWPVFVRSAGEAEVPALWLHGVPTSSDDWLPFLERAGGIAPDLPGFGRSSKRGDGPYTLDGLARFPGPLLDALGIDRVRLVVHDWGGAALRWAAEHPGRVDRLVILDAVPLLPGFRWRRWARAWRTPGLGELAVGLMTPRVLRRALPGGLGDHAAPHFDQGTQRAILRLYRSAPPERLAEAGRGLGALGDVPTLVVWGQEDPYLPPRLAHDYARALGGADVEIVPGAGHWPWIGDDAILERIAGFLR